MTYKTTLIRKLIVMAAATALLVSAGSAFAGGHRDNHFSRSFTRDYTPTPKTPDCPPVKTESVPDGGATVLLLGAGIGAAALANRKLRK